MKPHTSGDSATYRRRFGWTLLLICIAIPGLAAFSREAAPGGQPAGTPPPAQEPIAHPEFPAGDGREAVMRLCVKCHSPNIILASGQDRLGWENTITKMVRLGAQGNDEDFSDIADYLTKNFPPSPVKKIFVNMASDQDIASTLGISLDEAKALNAYRDKIKGFTSIEDMKKAPGIDPKKIDANKDRLVFGAGSTKPPAS